MRVSVDCIPQAPVLFAPFLDFLPQQAIENAERLLHGVNLSAHRVFPFS